MFTNGRRLLRLPSAKLSRSLTHYCSSEEAHSRSESENGAIGLNVKPKPTDASADFRKAGPLGNFYPMEESNIIPVP